MRVIQLYSGEMIDPECRKVTERYLCCCVRDAVVGREKKDDGQFEMSPVRVGEFILFYGRRRSTFPFHCLVGPDWSLNGTCVCNSFIHSDPLIRLTSFHLLSHS